MVKRRVNLTIEPRTLDILRLMCKEARRKVSVSEMIDHIVQTKCTDPIERKREEARELAKQINKLQEEIRFLEEIKKEGGNKNGKDLCM